MTLPDSAASSVPVGPSASIVSRRRVASPTVRTPAPITAHPMADQNAAQLSGPALPVTVPATPTAPTMRTTRPASTVHRDSRAVSCGHLTSQVTANRASTASTRTIPAASSATSSGCSTSGSTSAQYVTTATGGLPAADRAASAAAFARSTASAAAATSAASS